MGMIHGRGVLEIEADLAQIQAQIPAVEAALAEAEPKVQPAYDRFMELRAFGNEAGAALSTLRSSLGRAEAEAHVYTQTGDQAPRAMLTNAERLRGEVATAQEGYRLAREEEHRQQRAYNAANMAAHTARQRLNALRQRENALLAELAKAEGKYTKESAKTEAAKGWLAGLREKVAGAAA